jgi:hypothetical protein
MDGSQFQSLAAAGCGENGIPEAFEEFLFAFQYILVIVNAQKHFALGAQVGYLQILSVNISIWRNWSKLLTFVFSRTACRAKYPALLGASGALWVARYNSARVNTAVSMTPCMAAKITNTIWTMRDLLATEV